MLPKISYPTFTFKRPSDDMEIRFRPFNAKEEKILLMSREGNSTTDIYDTVMEILNACIISPREQDVMTWPTFDVEMFFVKVRSKSIGEMVEVIYNQGKDHYEASINLDDVYVDIKPDQKKKTYRTVALDERVGLVLRWPYFKQLAEFAYYCKAVVDGDIKATDKDVLDKSFKFFGDCIEMIYEGDTVYNKSDYSPNEIIEFISQLPVNKYEEIQRFVEKVPTIKYKGTYLTKDHEKKEFEVNGFVDFFTL